SSSTPESTSSSSTSSTTTTSGQTTTSTIGGPTPHGFDFTSTAGSGSCGETFRDLAGTKVLKELICGNLSIGGGLSTVPNNVTPPGSTNRFGLSCTGSSCTVQPVASAGVDFDCTATGCAFGTPLPIANGGLTVCVTNTFSQPVSGTLNTATGSASMNFQL